MVFGAAMGMLMHFKVASDGRFGGADAHGDTPFFGLLYGGLAFLPDIEVHTCKCLRCR